MTADLHAEAIALLEKAADDIDRYGHYKHGYCPPREPHPFAAPRCAMAALWLADGINPRRLNRVRSERVLAAREILAGYLLRERLAVDALGLIAHWNDADDTTPAKVVDALRAAARTARTP
jgi:hypothetical protein